MGFAGRVRPLRRSSPVYVSINKARVFTESAPYIVEDKVQTRNEVVHAALQFNEFGRIVRDKLVLG